VAAVRRRVAFVVAFASVILGIGVAILLPGPAQTPCPPPGYTGPYDCPGAAVGFFSTPRDVAILAGVAVAIVLSIIAVLTDP